MTYTLFFATIGFTAVVSWLVGRLTDHLRGHDEHFRANEAARRGLLSHDGACGAAAAAGVGAAPGCGSAGACH